MLQYHESLANNGNITIYFTKNRSNSGKPVEVKCFILSQLFGNIF